MTLTYTDILPMRIRERLILNGPVPDAPHTPVEGCCWLYDSWHNDAGYPYLRWEGRDQPAHRVVFVLVTGQNIDGLDLDHLCRNPACVRPSHHEAVTHAENQRRMALATTACRRAGHDWTDPRNVYTRPNGSRFCAECSRQAQRERYRAGIAAGLTSAEARRKRPLPPERRAS